MACFFSCAVKLFSVGGGSGQMSSVFFFENVWVCSGMCLLCLCYVSVMCLLCVCYVLLCVGLFQELRSHFARPQVEGLHPPESGVSSACTSGVRERFCSVAVFLLLSVETSHPLAASVSYGGLRGCIGVLWLVPTANTTGSSRGPSESIQMTAGPL